MSFEDELPPSSPSASNCEASITPMSERASSAMVSVCADIIQGKSNAPTGINAFFII